MTVAANSRRREYQGNGVTTIFNGPSAYGPDEITAFLFEGDVSTPVSPDDYQVSNFGRESGTRVEMAVPPASGQTLVLLRTVPYSQNVDITNQGAFLPEVVERGYDNLSFQTQQLADAVERSLRFPDNYPVAGISANMPFPEPGRALVWSEDGASIENAPLDVTGDLLLRKNLSEPGGASMVATVQTGNGMATRTIQANSELSLNVMDAVSVEDQSAVLDGTKDASAAISTVIDEAIARGRGGITLPAGRFLISSKVAKTISGQAGFSIEGAGMGITQLIVADESGGFEFTSEGGTGNWWLNTGTSTALRIANLSILATANNSGVGLKIYGNSLEGRPPAPVTLDHVEIRARSSIDTQAFLTGLWLEDCGSVYLTNCRFLVGGMANLAPTAVRITCTDSSRDPTLYFFDHCEWTYGGRGIVIGDYVEGVHLTNCAMGKGDVGVEWTSGSAESGLHVMGGHFNCLTYVFDLNRVYDFAITGIVSFLSGPNREAHVRVQNGSAWTITGNSFWAGQVGVDVGALPSGARGAYIGGNQFGNMAVGIALNANARNLTVGPNGYSSVGVRVSGSGGDGAFVQRRAWASSQVVTLTGGAAFEEVSIPIPPGTFASKPGVAVASAEASGAGPFVCNPNPANASSSATNLVLRIAKLTGTTPTGPIRINVVAYE